ncbi:hypothetical protein DMN91_010936 [Ooceraea biroi]|uniref:HTH cro/C1-type domain-containing protein n=1 Tax=Ooceraea biroi TaxID=2015173 RepID=A0A3L8DAC6_OOCBI|nr:uncharacterized protein LOC105274629 [Ooceraea biroi]RLU16868.1 hypothetical protein DMN91_010936 [Ooceraea biroi]
MMKMAMSKRPCPDVEISVYRFMLYCYSQGKSAEETQRLICEMYRENTLSIDDCEKRFDEFKSSRAVKLRDIRISRLSAMLKENPNLTQRELARQLGMCRSTVSKYLKRINAKQQKKKELFDKQVTAVAVWLLDNNQKMSRYSAHLTNLLEAYHEQQLLPFYLENYKACDQYFKTSSVI